MKQLNLFETKSSSVPPRKDKLVMDREELTQWKQRIFNYQQEVRKQKPPQQQTLFDLPSRTWHEPENIDPFTLRLHPADFYRTPEPAEPLDDSNQGVIYFIIDNSLPIILYIGQTRHSAHKRWKGVHDTKDYLMRYIEQHRQYELEVLPCSAFWLHIPPDKKLLLEWERALIHRWRPPFNRECVKYWGKPFGKR